MEKTLAGGRRSPHWCSPRGPCSLLPPPITTRRRSRTSRPSSLTRTDVREEKADIVAKTMELNAGEAALFWPVYKQYEAGAEELSDERLAIITDYAESFDTLSDEKAKDLVTRAVALDGKEHALKERYLKEFLGVLPAKIVARFYQVENRINNLIDLELSGQIPLVC
jgi:hypothetical protein